MKKISKVILAFTSLVLITACTNDINESIYGEEIKSYGIDKDKACPPGDRDCDGKWDN